MCVCVCVCVCVCALASARVHAHLRTHFLSYFQRKAGPGTGGYQRGQITLGFHTPAERGGRHPLFLLHPGLCNNAPYFRLYCLVFVSPHQFLRAINPAVGGGRGHWHISRKGDFLFIAKFSIRNQWERSGRPPMPRLALMQRDAL